MLLLIFRDSDVYLFSVDQNAIFFANISNINLKHQFLLNNVSVLKELVTKNLLFTMYCSLIHHKVTFDKKPILNPTEKKIPQLRLAVPIADEQAVLFYDNFYLYHIDLLTKKVLYEEKLEGRVYACDVLSDNKILLTVIQTSNVVQVDLKEKKVTDIYKFTSGSLYNPKKQAAQFFLSKIQTFSQSGSFYIQQNLGDDRKVKIIYFSKNLKKEQMNKEPFQVRQFEAKNYVYSKLNQVSSIVRFRQSPQENGTFSFQEINLQNNQTIEYKIEWPSFVLYSTIVDIKKFQQQKFIICLNSKNSAHEVLSYNKVEKTVEIVIKSKKIMRQCICINQKLNIGIFSFLCASYTGTDDMEVITIVSLKNKKVLKSFDIRVNQLRLAKNQEFMIEYSTEVKEQPETILNLWCLAYKSIHYLKMLQILKIKHFYGEQFVSLVLQMLKQ